MRAIVHLGGNPKRLQTTHIEVLRYPNSFVVFLTPENPEEFFRKMVMAGVPRKKILFGFKGWDTLTGFVELKNMLVGMGVKHIILVTDEGHLNPRSLWTAKIVFFMCGIKITGAAHPSPYKDPWTRVVVDVFRAVVHTCTDILLYNPKIRKERELSIAGFKREYLDKVARVV